MPIGRKPRTQKESSDKEMHPIFEDKVHYVKALAHFASKSDNRQVHEWADGDFVPAVSDKLGLIVGSSDKLRVLGIGFGTGDVELIFLKKLRSRFFNIDACILEPSQDLLTNHQSIVEDNKRDLEGVEFNWKNQSVEEHWLDRKYVERGPKYHFIHVFHSSYLQPLKVTLKQFREMLEPGGVLMVTAVTEDTGMGLIGKEFPDLGQNKKKEGDSDAVTSSKFIYTRNSTDVRAALNGLNIPYNLYQYTQHTDIGSCLGDRSATDSGLILDVLSHTIDFNKAAPVKLQQEFIDCLKEKCVEKKGEKDDGIYFSNAMDVYVISA